jgi:hypothetical protein
LISQSNSYAAAHTLRSRRLEQLPQEQQGETPMTALLVENLKLIILFLLISCIIGLSHFGSGNAMPVRPRALRKHGKPAPAGL